MQADIWYWISLSRLCWCNQVYVTNNPTSTDSGSMNFKQSVSAIHIKMSRKYPLNGNFLQQI